MTPARREFALALLLDVIGAAGLLLVSTRTWQDIAVTRAGQPGLPTSLTGRAVDGTVTALALVALAGVVALVATRGVVRQVLGAAVAAVGAFAVWRSIAAASAVSTGRARSLVAGRHHGASLSNAQFHVATHPAWAVLSAGCGVLVLLCGVWVAVRGRGWVIMTARYEAPAAEPDPARRDLSMWKALDEGEDPTS